ncbi:heat-inducible transcription repressor HrcA [Eubacterium ventriosum]|uniref:Heat-inducible transcription repressor HrcA n=1 Tax=Eubacterium ventriosum TaxID=39496 RepID=A0A413R8Q9_9FIRM|nr:heat-inducible transcriptional repressor HrcA [Eubacterium ventriosum]RHA18678.1 heat-inducible transcription repressor HrcA [Eubacterium ventriosum]
MELNERKEKILDAVIRNYLETGEPVGSRTISKYTDLNLSSATIRNEMSDLEELGYIVQPHTSAGRIPTDKGYRFYVDNILKDRMAELDEREKKVTEKEDLLIQKVDKVETLLQNMAKMLATNTNYATMVSTPKAQTNRIKFVQLSVLEEKSLLCTVVSDKNHVVNKIVKVSKGVNQEIVVRLNVALNTVLAGLSIEEINLGVMTTLASQAGEFESVVSEVLKAITEAIATEEQMKIYTSGATNIFKYPELSDKERASQLLTTLEEKSQLTELINEGDEKTGIQVYIGSESPVQSMKDCSVVTATYELEDGFKGTIGIIGPKRMDYEKVVDALRNVKEQLSDTFKDEHL